MCGRFAQVYDDSALKSEFQIENIQNKINKRFNLSPGMEINTILIENDVNTLKKQHWGIDNIRGKELDNSVFNTRYDTFLTNNFGRNFHNSRCIVPVTGFYEWNNKVPYFIKYSDDRILSLAGVYTFNKNRNEYSCSILTVSSMGLLSNIHERMPVILYGYDKFRWMDNHRYDQSSLENICLKRIENDELSITRVSDRVNSLLHDSPQCIVPVKEESLF
ncbi:MAG: SOS response-associated peptidase [Candidatus Delongbacteria bacterium]|jgi:putative SOS response-associated peptidase YedK|nr:SOS response-associated peptidase [Candidatus Delongbacteria bacterium]